MEYATLAIGAAAPAQSPKAKTAAPKRRAFPALDAPQERHRRGACRPPAICPAVPAAYGFLKTRFLPHYTGQAAKATEGEKEQFYASYDLLCHHYGIVPIETRSLTYPYGRDVALCEAQRLLREKYPQQIAIVFEEDENGDFALNVTESYNTQHTLYYIPVVPLYRMLKDRRKKTAAKLLLCCFAYLYHVAGVPYYADEDTYLYWQYDMVSQWVLDEPQEWEAEEYSCYASQIHTASHVGDVMLRKLWNPIHLNNFQRWFSAFRPKDAFGRECRAIAQRALQLFRDYPQAHLYTHADSSCLPDPEDGYDDNDCITMEKYIGFVATTKDWLYDSVEQGINAEFGECSSIQEPVVQRRFDGRAQQEDSLGFECRLFPLINDLCYFLNNCENDT